MLVDEYPSIAIEDIAKIAGGEARGYRLNIGDIQLAYEADNRLAKYGDGHLMLERTPRLLGGKLYVPISSLMPTTGWTVEYKRFEDLITSNIPVLVDFFAEWCGPCKAMKPILEELKGIKGEKVRIVKVDVDKHKEIAAYYQIQSVPTLMIFKDGKQLWRQSGVMRANDLSIILAQYE